jgi:hypothetical protein
MNQLDFEQSPVYVSIADVLVFSTDTEDYGGSPTVSSVVAKNLTTGQTVTSSIVSGSATIDGDVITWPSVSGFLKGYLYAVEITFICGSNTYKRRELFKAII